MTTETIIVRADELQPGDVILTPGFDAHGRYIDWRFEVTSQPQIYRHKVRFGYDHDRSQTLDRDLELRVERSES